jgi:lysine 6-dehydrogenase
MAISAVPSSMGFATLQAVLQAGRNVVDIAFFAEDPRPLDAIARERGVTAVIDCGVAPGMSNILVAHGATGLDTAERAVIYVGGLPQVRQWPFEYKVVFSFADVIEEYTRPARLVKNGRVETRPALSDAELVFFPGVGTLEAFNTDGLRSLIHTMEIPDMQEKTLRYPGHIEKMAALRETGFFDTEEILVGGGKVRPLDVSAALLQAKLAMQPEEIDLTVMRVEVSGRKNGAALKVRFDLFDRRDPQSGIHSMARTTGYSATMMARLLMEGLFDRKGVYPPEIVGGIPRCAEYLLAGLKARGVCYTRCDTPC